MKYALLLKHTIIGIFMCLSLSYFAFCVMELTKDFKGCPAVCKSFLGMFVSLMIFLVALFASQMSLYYMVY